MSEEQINTSRLRRAASMTGAAAGVAAREATARALLIGGSSEARRRRATGQQLKSAEALVRVLGGMRGAAMKIGQTLSAVDLGLVPEEIRPQFQEILSALQQDAPAVPFRTVRKVIEQELGERVSDVFADFDETPLAAASIGQVHRAVLPGGREVAVKVQYPGIAEAVRADMQNVRLSLKLLSMIAPGIATDGIAQEIRERIGQELDYELEAASQHAMARVYRGHPFIVVPDVVSDLCRQRVLVSELVPGARFADVRTRDAAERDQLAEVLVRFYFSGPLRHRLLNGDPHPGNALFLDDGRVAFVDFGFFKTMNAEEVAQLIASTRATYERDATMLFDVMARLGALPPDPALAEPFLEAYDSIFGWLLTDQVVVIDGSATGRMMRAYSRLRSLEQFESLRLPPQHFVLMRAVMLLIGLLGQLQAQRNWLEVSREWLLGEPPVTELGGLEAEFFAGRPYPSA